MRLIISGDLFQLATAGAGFLAQGFAATATGTDSLPSNICMFDSLGVLGKYRELFELYAHSINYLQNRMSTHFRHACNVAMEKEEKS
jgi:hypothetical protein